MKTLLHLGLRLALALVCLTVVGQIPWKGRSLERRYHEWVNGRAFQTTYWTIMHPATWTCDKVAFLIHGERPEAR